MKYNGKMEHVCEQLNIVGVAGEGRPDGHRSTEQLT